MKNRFNFGSLNGKVHNWHSMISEFGPDKTDELAFFDTREEAESMVNKYENKKVYSYSFPMAGLTADCILLRKNPADGFDILLIRRGGEPFANFLALPGGFVEVDKETVKQAVIREILEETSVELKENQVDFFKFADRINRDPRGRTITFVFAALLSEEQVDTVKAGDDASSFVWIKLNDYILDMKLAFDHEEIIESFLNK